MAAGQRKALLTCKIPRCAFVRPVWQHRTRQPLSGFLKKANQQHWMRARSLSWSVRHIKRISVTSAAWVPRTMTKTAFHQNTWSQNFHRAEILLVSTCLTGEPHMSRKTSSSLQDVRSMDTDWRHISMRMNGTFLSLNNSIQHHTPFHADNHRQNSTNT